MWRANKSDCTPGAMQLAAAASRAKAVDLYFGAKEQKQQKRRNISAEAAEPVPDAEDQTKLSSDTAKRQARSFRLMFVQQRPSMLQKQVKHNYLVDELKDVKASA